MDYQSNKNHLILIYHYRGDSSNQLYKSVVIGIAKQSVSSPN